MGEIGVFALVTIHHEPVEGEEIHVFAAVNNSWFSDAYKFKEVLFVEFYAI